MKKIVCIMLTLFMIAGLVGCKSNEYKPMKRGDIVEIYDEEVKKLIEKYAYIDENIGIRSIEVQQSLSKEMLEGSVEITVLYELEGNRLGWGRAIVRPGMLLGENYYHYFGGSVQLPTVEKIMNGTIEEGYSEAKDFKVKKLGENYYKISYYFKDDFYSFGHYLYSEDELKEYQEYFEKLKYGY